MKIEFTLTDDSGRSFKGAAQLREEAARKGADRPGEKGVGQPEPDGLPARILALRDVGFFQEPRTPAEVHEKLLESYHCLLNRVQMALLRLQRRRDLRKTVKKVGEHDHTAFVW